jgi:hypothetical protein
MFIISIDSLKLIYFALRLKHRNWGLMVKLMTTYSLIIA